MHAIFSPRRGLKKEQTTCEILVMLFDALLGGSQIVCVVRTVQEFIWTSGEMKVKKYQQTNELHLNACLQADVGNFMKPSEIKVT